MRWVAIFGAVWLASSGPALAATNELTPAQQEGRELARQLIEGVPTDNSTLTGVLKIRAVDGRRSELPMTFRTILTATNWAAIYEVSPTNGVSPARLVITHDGADPNRYELDGVAMSPGDAAVPFAGTDFWVMDLGLEFFHWPEQRVLKKELRRSRSCAVLESVNPEPKPGTYTRVVSWVDRETGGVVHADAYAGDRKLKEFEPKSFKKVNGVWQLREVQIENVQAGSRTRLEFDLGSK